MMKIETGITLALVIFLGYFIVGMAYDAGVTGTILGDVTKFGVSCIFAAVSWVAGYILGLYTKS